jgi:hypothetical protein
MDDITTIVNDQLLLDGLNNITSTADTVINDIQQTFTTIDNSSAVSTDYQNQINSFTAYENTIADKLTQLDTFLSNGTVINEKTTQMTDLETKVNLATSTYQETIITNNNLAKEVKGKYDLMKTRIGDLSKRAATLRKNSTEFDWYIKNKRGATYANSVVLRVGTQTFNAPYDPASSVLLYDKSNMPVSTKNGVGIVPDMSPSFYEIGSYFVMAVNSDGSKGVSVWNAGTEKRSIKISTEVLNTSVAVFDTTTVFEAVVYNKTVGWKTPIQFTSNNNENVAAKFDMNPDDVVIIRLSVATPIASSPLLIKTARFVLNF